MKDSQKSSIDLEGNNDLPGKGGGNNKQIAKIKKKRNKSFSNTEKGDVLLSVGGLKYRAPGKRQRLVIGSIVVGLNILLVVAVIIYFYSPDFQTFIYNVGRN